MQVKELIARACEGSGMHVVMFTGTSDVERIMAQAALQVRAAPHMCAQASSTQASSTERRDPDAHQVRVLLLFCPCVTQRSAVQGPGRAPRLTLARAAAQVPCVIRYHMPPDVARPVPARV